MSKIHPAWIIYPAAIVLGVAIGAALHFAHQAIKHPEPTVTVTTAPEPTPTYTGSTLLDEVASQQGINVTAAESAAHDMCAALDGGAEPVGVVLQTWEAAASLGKNAPGVVIEFGAKAYCPEYVDALQTAVAKMASA